MMGKVNALRKRLTVGECDPVAGSVRGSSKETTPELLQILKGNKVADQLEAITGSQQSGRRGSFTMSSTTDQLLAGKKSHEEKDQTVEGVEADKAKQMMADMGIGVCCKKGLKPESPNQDSYTVIVAEDKFKLLGVYDGHGPAGHDVSQYAKESIVKFFLKFHAEGTEPREAFVKAFENTQKVLESAKQIDTQLSGSTCTFIYIATGGDKIIVAHVGDSRAVLATKQDGKWKAMPLTEDHKPNLPKEQQRIEAAGGKVVFDGYFNHRVFTKDGRGGLNMSRALGDCVAHKAGVTATPVVNVATLGAKMKEPGTEDILLLICSDGVWEFIDNQQAVDIVTKDHCGRAKTQAGAELLAKESYNKWLEDSEGEVADDITVIYAFLP